ncbi:MAG: hypothetical protein ACR2JK_12820 [Geodermatophilaceae bacterium]
MDNMRLTWNEAADKLGGLGLKLKLHYEEQQGADRDASRAEVQSAVQRLGDAVQVAFEAMGAAAKDDAVKEDVKQVGQALTDALRATFNEVSGEVRGALKRRTDTDPPPPDQPAPAPPADTV